MSYGAYEIITYGGGQTFVGVINAVALLSGSSTLKSIMTVALLSGLLIGILKAAFDFNVGNLLRWLIMSVVIYGVMWIPTVKVHITDRFNPGLQGADIANVPLGVAFAAATSTEIGDTFITITQNAFNDPTSLAFNNTGMIYGAKLYGAMSGWHVSNPLMAQSLQAYFKDCIADDIIDNNIAMDTVENSPDLWGALKAAANPAVNTQDWANGASGQAVSCPQAASDIDNMWANEIAQNKTQQQTLLQSGGLVGTGQSSIDTTVGDLTNATFGQATTSTALFKQALTITALQQSFASYASEAGSSTALQVFSNLQAQNQNNMTSQSTGQMAQKAIPILQIVMLVLFIGMFPIMVPAFLLPGIGPKMMQAYFASFLYLQLWGPMYVVLNKVFLSVITSQTLASTFLPSGTSAFGPQNAFTFANLVSASSVNQQISNVAGMMMLSIPLIAGLLTKGAMDGGGALMGALGGFRAAAEAKGQMEATRNISLGNTSLDNVQFENATARQVRTSPSIDTGRFSYVDGRGSTVTVNPDHSVAVTAANSNVPFSSRITSGVSNAASEGARHAQERSEAISNTWTQARARTSTAMSEAGRAYVEGRDWRSSVGADERGGISEAMSSVESVANRLHRDHGMSQSEARAIALRAAADIGGNGVLGTPFRDFAGQGVDVKAGLRGSLSGDQTKNSTAQASVRMARDMLKSDSFDQKIDHSNQHFATEILGDNAGRSDTYRTLSSSAFASSASVSDALARTRSEREAFERAATYTRTEGFQADSNTTNAAVNFLRRRLDDETNPVRDWYGNTVALSDLVNPVGPDALRYMQLRDNLLQPFYSQQAASIARDPFIVAAEDAANTKGFVKNPGAFSVGPGRVSDGSNAVSGATSHLGQGPLPRPEYQALDPTRKAGLDLAGRRAQSAGESAEGRTGKIKEEHPAGILDLPGDGLDLAKSLIDKAGGGSKR